MIISFITSNIKLIIKDIILYIVVIKYYNYTSYACLVFANIKIF